MKTIFTFLIISACILLPSTKASSQNCNSSAGSNGQSTALTSPITIDGNMADWAPYLNDPDNNSYDNTGGVDLDAPISDAGRDLVRFAFTESASNLYIYLARAGSVNNTVDIVFYVDLNNNDVMEAREPVFHINWSGSNGNVTVDVNDYNPSLLSILLNTISVNLDGNKLMGSLSHRGNQGPGSSSGKGSVDGKSVEVKIPFTQITTLNLLGGVVKQLASGEDFKFHVSTINGNVSSIPGSNSINDNFGGCLKAPPAQTLPVDLLSFTAALSGNNKVDLKWTTASEVNASHFIVERSLDGSEYSEAGMVFASGNTTDIRNYQFSDNIIPSGKSLIYYRIRQVDMDGKAEYSATRIVHLSKQSDKALAIIAFPNPVNSELRVSIPAQWQNKSVIYELYRENGQVAARLQTSNSTQTESLNLSKLPRGVYIMKVTCQGETAQQKIIKH